MPSLPTRALAIVLLPWLGAACTSPAERRAAVDEISLGWHANIGEETQEDLLEHVRALGDADPSERESILAVPVLARLVIESPSSLVRAEALTSAWRLCADAPREPPLIDERPTEELLASIDRLLELDADPQAAEGAEGLALADSLVRHRFGPAQLSLAITLGEMAAHRGLGADSPVVRLFHAEAPASLRHALALVTERAANDREAVVRQAAYAAAPLLHPQLGLSLVADALLTEEDPDAHRTVLDVFAEVGDQMSLDDRMHLLDQLVPQERAAGAVMTDLAVRRRVDALRSEWSP